MKKYILKRILYSIVAVLVLLLLLFTMLELMPGSPFNDDKLSDEQIAALYEKYGLDQPVYIRYFRYVFSIVKGDFGDGESVLGLVRSGCVTGDGFVSQR